MLKCICAHALPKAGTYLTEDVHMLKALAPKNRYPLRLIRIYIQIWVSEGVSNFGDKVSINISVDICVPDTQSYDVCLQDKICAPDNPAGYIF